MSLREPIPLMPPDQLGAVHFIAMGGSGMSGIALAFHELGVPVSGCDQVDSPILEQLRADGITAWVGHDPAQLDGVDTVVVSSAIHPDNVELLAAWDSGLRIWHRSAALASLMLGHEAVSVAGTHGKTTTSAMIAAMAAAAGSRPSYVIGSPLASTGNNAKIDIGHPFIVEADESDGSFLQYPTTLAVITNIEADHLDNWGTPENYAQGFARFATGSSVRKLVIDADDAGARELTGRLAADPRAPEVTTYGEAPDADARLTDITCEGMHSEASLHFEGERYQLSLAVPGRHNLWNAAAAFVACRVMGMEAAELVQGAHDFSGTLRRFQPLGHANVQGGPVSVFDDYAHHPTEIRAALEAGRRVAGDNRLVACFQPHLYSRTEEFAQEFGQALALADVVVITDVYASREEPVPGVTGKLVADAAIAAGADTLYVPDKANLPEVLAGRVRGGDCVLTLGAGDVTLVGPILLRTLRAMNPQLNVDDSRADGAHGHQGPSAAPREHAE